LGCGREAMCVQAAARLGFSGLREVRVFNAHRGAALQSLVMRANDRGK
jgi:hypothetical protein